MNQKKFLFAAIVGAITLFVLGGLIYGVFLMNFINSHSALSPDVLVQVNKPMEKLDWVMLILSNVAAGFLIALVCKWGNFKTHGESLKAGAMFGFLYAASIDLGFLSFTNMLTLTSAAADVLGNTVMTAVAFVVVAKLLRKSK